MIIKHLKINNFGKFHNKEITFSRGLNLIYGENEAGKSTLHTFIRGMLFGIEKQRGRASKNDLYSKFLPWDNPSNYSGTMIIEVGDVDYRLERDFNKDHKSFKVINQKLGIRLSEEEIDRLYNGLNEAGYNNTISIGQLGGETDNELETILKNYATNLASTKSTELDMQKAIDNLKQKKKEIKAMCRGLEKNTLITKDLQLDDQILLLDHNQTEIEEENSIALAAYQDLAEELSKLERIEQEQRDESTRRGEKARHLNERMAELNKEYNEQQKAADQQKAVIDNIEDELDQSGIKSASDMEGYRPPASNKSLLWFMIPILFIEMAVLVYCIAADKNIFIAVAAGVILAGSAAVFIARLKYYKNMQAAQAEHMKTLKMLIQKKETEMNGLEVKLDKLSQTAVYIDKIKSDLDEMSTDNRMEELIVEINTKKVNAKALSKAIQNNQWKLEQNKEKAGELEKEKILLKEQMEKIIQTEDEIEAIDLAIINIEEIAREIRGSFGKKLNDKASHYISMITKGKYDSLIIEDNLNIEVNSKEKLIEHHKLSKGTIEQIYLALRLAAADIIFSDEKPILLDDAFAHYDSNRMESTLEALSKYFEQVILFSCHSSEIEMLEKTEIKYERILI